MSSRKSAGGCVAVVGAADDGDGGACACVSERGHGQLGYQTGAAGGADLDVVVAGTQRVGDEGQLLGARRRAVDLGVRDGGGRPHGGEVLGQQARSSTACAHTHDPEGGGCGHRGGERRAEDLAAALAVRAVEFQHACRFRGGANRGVDVQVEISRRRSPRRHRRRRHPWPPVVARWGPVRLRGAAPGRRGCRSGRP